MPGIGSPFCCLTRDRTSSGEVPRVEPIRVEAHRMLIGRTGRFLRQGLFAISLIALAAVPVLAEGLPAPAADKPASLEHHLGKVVFVELVTPDLAVAKKFYAGLFGWTFHDLDETGKMKYSAAFLDGEPVAGLVHKELSSGARLQPAWLTFFAADDVDAVKNVAVKNGAKLLAEPHDVPSRGRVAVLADPQGAVFALLASKNGDPPDLLPLPGEWIWSSLITTDPDTDAAFYQKLFNYDVFELPASPGAEHLMLASENYARASVNTIPANRPKAHPHWLNYVRVEDADLMTAKVLALGGRVLVETRVDRHGGKVTVVADPLGAPFGLLEWTDSDSKEVPK
jgi:uncharacterized protein